MFSTAPNGLRRKPTSKTLGDAVDFASRLAPITPPKIKNLTQEKPTFGSKIQALRQNFGQRFASFLPSQVPDQDLNQVSSQAPNLAQKTMTTAMAKLRSVPKQTLAGIGAIGLSIPLFVSNIASTENIGEIAQSLLMNLSGAETALNIVSAGLVLLKISCSLSVSKSVDQNSGRTITNESTNILDTAQWLMINFREIAQNPLNVTQWISGLENLVEMMASIANTAKLHSGNESGKAVNRGDFKNLLLFMKQKSIEKAGSINLESFKNYTQILEQKFAGSLEAVMQELKDPSNTSPQVLKQKINSLYLKIKLNLPPAEQNTFDKASLFLFLGCTLLGAGWVVPFVSILNDSSSLLFRLLSSNAPDLKQQSGDILSQLLTAMVGNPEEKLHAVSLLLSKIIAFFINTTKTILNR